MPKSKPPPKPTDDEEQSRRFIETAKELGVDESPDRFDRAFAAVRPPDAKNPPPGKTRGGQTG